MTEEELLAIAERNWRSVIRMRCEWHTMLFGSWCYSTPRQIASETPVMHHDDRLLPGMHRRGSLTGA
jgi:hypothetical protein